MLYLIVVSLLWAPSFGLVPYVRDLGSDFVAATRILLSLIVLLPFVRVRELTAARGAALAGIGALQFGLMYVLYIRSYAWLRPEQVALFTVMTPLYVTLFDDLLARHFTPLFLGTALLATVGTAICQWKGLGSGSLWTGFLMMQASNACFAGGQVLYRRTAGVWKVKDHEVMAVLYAGAAIVACAFMLRTAEAARLATASATQVIVLIYLGAVASGLGFLLFNAGARRVDVGTLAVFNNVKVPLAILCTAVVFGAAVSWPQLTVGGTLIAVALFWNERASHTSGAGVA